MNGRVVYSRVKCDVPAAPDGASGAEKCPILPWGFRSMARPTLERNVKFKALVKRLDLPRPYVRGLLETMWDVAHECGNPVMGSADDVEIAAEWPGQTGQLFESLKSGGWIEELPDGRFQIHDYWDHAPSYVKDRKRKEDERKNKDLGSRSPGLSRISPNSSATPAPAPAPAPIQKHALGKPSERADSEGPSPGFDRFWHEWPSHHRKRARSKCLRLWRRLKLEPIAAQVIGALRRDKASRQWAEQAGRFIPGPEPWLNDTPWETDPAELGSPAAPEDDPMSGNRKPVTDDVLEAAGLPTIGRGAA
jgi:hypothetical protein